MKNKNTLNLDLLDKLTHLIGDLEDISQKIEVRNDYMDYYRNYSEIMAEIHTHLKPLPYHDYSKFAEIIAEVTQKCSKSKNTEGTTKVFKLMKSANKHLKFFCENMNDDSLLKKLNHAMNVDIKMAEKLISSYFFSIKTDKEEIRDTTSRILLLEKESELEVATKENQGNYISKPIFTNKPAGFKKQLLELGKEIVAVFIDTKFNSNIWGSLIKECHKIRPGLQVFLIVDDFDLFSTLDTIKLGITKIIKRPLSYDEVINHFEKYKIDSPIIDDPNAKFMSISPMILLNESPSLFDIYMNIGDEKFIKIVHKGNTPDPKQIKRHQKKGARRYFVKRIDYKNYLIICSKEIDAVLTDPHSNFLIRNINLTEYGEDTYNFLISTGINKNDIELSKKFIEKSGHFIENFVSKDKKIKEFILNLELIEHAVSVSLICNLFLNEMGASDEMGQSIALGALLHDISLADQSEKIRTEDVSILNKSELEILYNHPEESARITEKLGLAPSISEAIRQHHLKSDNLGYPKDEIISADKKNYIGELIALADDFLLFVQKNEKKDMTEVIKEMRQRAKEQFSAKMFNFFEKIFP